MELKSEKLELKSEKHLYKNRNGFGTDSRTFFFRSWVDFGTKNRSKMKGLGITFSTLLRIGEKCDFEQHS